MRSLSLEKKSRMTSDPENGAEHQRPRDNASAVHRVRDEHVFAPEDGFPINAAGDACVMVSIVRVIRCACGRGIHRESRLPGRRHVFVAHPMKPRTHYHVVVDARRHFFRIPMSSGISFLAISFSSLPGIAASRTRWSCFLCGRCSLQESRARFANWRKWEAPSSWR